MTTSDFPSSFASEMFTLVAQGGKSFFVHSSLLAAQSQPLRSLISGVWKESTERRISLQDWDDDTVGRFIEFLYTGNYQYPDPEPLPPGEVVKDETSTIEEHKDMELSMMNKGKVLSQNRPLTPLDQCIQRSPRQQWEHVDEVERLEKFSPSQHDYKALLLAHAKVYALAQYKDVATLRSLSLERLLVALMRLNPVNSGSHIVTNIVELLGYVYSHTDAPENYEEPMRQVVSQFVALNFLVLQADEEMMVSMDEGGDLVRDLMGKVRRRLVFAEVMLFQRQGELEECKSLLFQAEVNIGPLKENNGHLKEELKTVKGELRTTKGELRTAKEELKTAKGGLKTAKEELGATKEELKTAKEELKTTKEGLKALKKK